MIFSAFKKKKDFRAQISPSEQEITINKGETLLSGALRSGLAWPHKCQVGSCGTCRCKIIDGTIRPEIDFNYVLDPADVAFPRTANNITKYREHTTLYRKGTPIHVRGCIMYNHFIREKKLDKKYNIINNG